MSVYANETIAHRFPGFSAPKPKLSHEIKAVLAALGVWALVLGALAVHDVDTSDIHTGTNFDELRFDVPEAEQFPPNRQHY